MLSNSPLPEISPELVTAQLVHEVDIQALVSIDVGDGESVAVVVVHQLVSLARVRRWRGGRT